MLIVVAAFLMTMSAAIAGAGDRDSEAPRRPLLLPPLYASFAFLEGFDVQVTVTALQAGAVEANPIMKPVTKHPWAFVAVKAGATSLSILAAEKLGHRGHRREAVLTMVALNGLMGYFAVHNWRVRQSHEVSR